VLGDEAGHGDVEVLGSLRGELFERRSVPFVEARVGQDARRRVDPDDAALDPL